MKKTLFLAAAGLLGLCFQAQAITVTISETKTTTRYIDTSKDFSMSMDNGNLVTFDTETGLLDGWNTADSLTLTLVSAEEGKSTRWDEEQFLIYTGVSVDANTGTVTPSTSNSYGFKAMSDGTITGIAQGKVWNDAKNKTVAVDKITDTVKVKLEGSSQGTNMYDSAGTGIFNVSGLRYGAANTYQSFINTNLISQISVEDTLNTYSLTTEKWTKSTNSAESHVITAATGNDGKKYKLTASNSSVLSKKNIVVGGDSQLYIEGSGLSSEFNIESNIYIGTTSYTENGYNDIALRIGNDTKYIKLSGNLYLVEDAAIKGGSTNSYNIAGTVTDKVDNVDTQSTLTVYGSGANFTGEVDLKGLVIKNGATFGNTVNVDNMTVSGNIGVGGKITATNLTLNTDATLTFSGGTLDVGNSITLSTVTLSDYSKYFDADNLTQTLVSSGGISGWNGAIKSTYEANGTTYNTAIDQVGNNIVLTYAEQTASITTTVVEKHIVDGVEAYLYSLEGTTLTLTVMDSLAGLTADGQVSLSLISEGMMQDILTKLNGTEWVTLNLTDGNGNDIVAGEDAVVAFFNEKGQGYWGENVGNGLQYNVERIPEPTTTTLSLLALAGLAARRRRQK